MHAKNLAAGVLFRVVFLLKQQAVYFIRVQNSEEFPPRFTRKSINYLLTAEKTATMSTFL